MILLIAGQQLYSQNAFLFSPDATVPKNDTVVIKLHDYVGDIQWQKTLELDGSDNWENIANATADTLLFIADTTTYFRARVVAGHCDPFYSDTTHVSVYRLKEKVVLVELEGLQLISDTLELADGSYRFIGDQGDIDIGSIIVSSDGAGYLRKVTGITIAGDTISLETEQGTMEDVFDDFYLENTIVITLDQNKKSMAGARRIPMERITLPPGVKFRSSGIGLDFSNTVIYSDNNITVGIEEGIINFEPSIDVVFDFGWLTGLKHMEFVASGMVESDFDFYIQCTQAVNYAKSIPIGPPFTVLVPIGPIPVTVTLKFYLGFNANMEAEIYATAGYDSNYEVAFGAEYNKNASPQWQAIWERDADFIPHNPTFSIHGELSAKTYVKPELSLTIAGVAGTTLYVDPYLRAFGEFDYPSPTWSWELAAGIGGYLNFKVGIFGFNIANFNWTLLNWEKIIAEGYSEIEPNTPTLTTTAVSNITINSATSGGNITSDGGKPVTARGVVWSANPNPSLASNQGLTINGTGTGAYVSNLTGLIENTTYYVRAYATNSNGTSYGNELNFTTLSTSLPSLTTTAITNITINSATSGGNITSDGGKPVTARGVVWNTSPNPTISNNDGQTSNGTGTGSFVSNLTGLDENTMYYVRAYATNSNGTAYGNERSFTTASTSLPTLTTAAVTNITTNSATSGGNITSDGGQPVTARGVVWNTTPNPTLGSNQGFTTNGTGTGAFVSNLTGLSQNTTYFVRAYATNSNGTAYGNELEFTTAGTTLPTLTTAAVTNITTNSATSGGNITSDGGQPVTARGVVWNTTPNPTLGSNQGFTTNGTGTGAFVSNLTGLSQNTTYYVRAYATNSNGTAYGNELEFITLGSSGCGSPVTFTYNGSSVTYGTVVSANDKCWLDRNLGATQVATSSTDVSAYGDLFQWGRLDDGHQVRTSPTTTTLSNSDVPGHNMFIKAPNNPFDWRSPQNNNLWQGEGGTNNPCPDGYRLPTQAEWDTERASWNTNNAAGAFASPLKLPMAGYRDYFGGSVDYEGSGGNYWSSTVSGVYAWFLGFYSDDALMYSYYRALGFSVRCLKD